MKPNVLLTGFSLLSILLCTFHLADDIVYGWAPGTLGSLSAVPIFVVWLYGTLLLRERLAGYIIMLVGSLLSLAMPVLHMSGRGIGQASRVANTSWHHVFVWTLIALGVTGLFSFVLSVEAIIRRARRPPSGRPSPVLP